MIRTKSEYGKVLYINPENINYISVDKKNITVYFKGIETGVRLEPQDNFCIEEFLNTTKVEPEKIKKTKAAPKKRQSYKRYQSRATENKKD